MSLIRSVYEDQDELIAGILQLHCPSGRIDCDPTYSKGVFYQGSITPPDLKFDINPQVSGVEAASADALPLADCSLDTIMFDPPFLATTGPSLRQDDGSNRINKRFGVFASEVELHAFYARALAEFHRILRPGGVLIFKCQDKVSSGKQYLSHVFVINQAEATGFYSLDLFILLAKQRIVADWQKANQKHARKFHSYFLVFRKSSARIRWT